MDRFRSVDGALQTVAGYEAMHAILKGQIRWLPKGDVVGQVPIHPAESSALPPDHRSRRFNPRPLHAVCDRSLQRAPMAQGRHKLKGPGRPN